MDKKKYKIGYTTGVFDMFHVGHLNIIKKSKKLCEQLIVGVSTDSLSEYKNKKPIIKFSDRIEIIESIKYVDKAVPQENMNKFNAWEKLKFDAIFVGSDWKGTKKWDDIEKKFLDVGVDVVYFDYTNNISSSKLRNHINKLEK